MSGHDLHIPPEISIQIFIKLPVKSILRFRCGCKSWYSLISSPAFISDHTGIQSAGNRVLVRRVEPETGMSTFSFHDESFVESHEHYDLPEPLRNTDFVTVGHCNGLICLRRKLDKAKSFLIWNPSILQLPFPSSSSPNLMYLLGFGFDPESNDYKVLRIVYAWDEAGDDYEWCGGLLLVKSHVFDLRKGVWRSLSDTMRPDLYDLPYSCVYLNGILHWIRRDHGPDLCDYLLFFNLSSVVFLEMGMPYDLLGVLDDSTKLFLINGLLSVALLRRHGQGDDRQDWCSVWSMQEYGGIESWTKLFRIKLPCNLTWTLTRLVRCWENGEVLTVVC